MKRYLMMVILAAGCLLSYGAERSDELVELQKKLAVSVKIGTVNSDTVRNDSNEKLEVFKFHTYQDERDKGLNFRVRVTVEMTDKSGSSCFAQLNREQGPLHEEYTGEDDWEFYIPHGSMERPKVTAYAIQYGILEDGSFIPVVEKLSKVDSVDEITKRTSCRAEFTKTLHSYKYRNLDEEIVSSNPN